MRVLLFNTLFFSTTFTMAFFGLIASIAPSPKPLRWFLRRNCSAVNWYAKTLLGARIELRGLERFENGDRPAIIASKHQSELDVWTPLYLYSDLSAIAMAELARYPLIGPVMRRLDYILVNVEGPRKNQLSQVIEGARKANDAGRPILIYPEGELMRIGSRQRYRSGIWHIYDELKLPVTPVALSCGLVWPQRKWRKNLNQTCVIEFMEPIQPGLDKDTFMELLERTIEDRSMELIREHGSPEDVRVAEERYRLKLSNKDPETKTADPAEAA